MPSLSNIAAQNLQRLIANGTYPQGSSLPSQRDLAETLGISRACLREAVSMLEALGPVRSHAGKGVFVTAGKGREAGDFPSNPSCMRPVMTAGICTTPAQSHAVSVIPGDVQFSFEIRSQDVDTLERFTALLLEESRAVEQMRGVRFEFGESMYTAPATMAPDWITRIETAALTRNAPIERLPSGAGHDAAVFADAGIPAAMVFVRNANGSHNVHEAMEYADFLDGVDLLHKALLDT